MILFLFKLVGTVVEALKTCLQPVHRRGLEKRTRLPSELDLHVPRRMEEIVQTRKALG
jgi:hypothetical protein